MDAASIYEAADPVEAAIVCNMLAVQGIEATIVGGHGWGGRGDLPANVYPRLFLLDAHDRPRALAILRAYQADTDPGEDWTCPDCGEHGDARFDQCWKCGAERPR